MMLSLVQHLRIAVWLSLILTAAGMSLHAQEDVTAADSAVLIILSDPKGASIYLNSRELGLTAPAEVIVVAGEYVVELVIEGSEPLAKRFTVGLGQKATLNFVMSSLPPPPATLESLGLMHLPKIPLMDEKVAEKVRKRWLSLSETFAVVPLGQGLLARAILPPEHHASANAMILAGVGLTVTTYLLGKILGRRKLRKIRERNEQIPEENALIRQTNESADQAVQDANSMAITLWLEQNSNRGKVLLSIE